MLAEIAAANAAFAVIKGALANGNELHQLGSRVFDFRPLIPMNFYFIINRKNFEKVSNVRLTFF